MVSALHLQVEADSTPKGLASVLGGIENVLRSATVFLIPDAQVYRLQAIR